MPVAAPDDVEQPLDHVRRAQQVSPCAEPVPQQFGRWQLQQSGRALIVMDDLEIERLAGGIADRRKRQDAFVGGGENRIQQIIFASALVDVDPDQRAAPARGRRQRQDIVGPDHAVAHAMRRGQIGTAVSKRAGRGFAERGGAIRRQRGQRNIPAVVAEPFLHVTAGARYFEHVMIVLRAGRCDPPAGRGCPASRLHSEAALRRAATRPAICAAEPGTSSNISVLHLPDDFFLAAIMSFPTARIFNPTHPMQAGLMRCENCGSGTPIRRL